MGDWLKPTTLIPLTVFLVGLVGSYATQQAQYAVLEQRVVQLEKEIAEVKPILSDLSHSINGLNVTLARIESKLEAK